MATDTPMQLGMIGLGRMGANLVRRLMADGHRCVVYDVNPDAVAALGADGATATSSLTDFVAALDAPRAVWIMVPAAIVGPSIDELVPLLDAGDTVIDGGNSYYRDDIHRAEALAGHGIHYVDCGTSGGVWGLDRGYCLMIGGEDETVGRLAPIWESIAPGPMTGTVSPTPDRGPGGTAQDGWLHCGPNGAGHFVKMVHNGIEYGMMATIAEGLSINAHAGIGRDAATAVADAETTPLRDPWAYQYDIDARSGADLDAFAAMFGFYRIAARRAHGTILLQRTTPAPESVIIPAGFVKLMNHADGHRRAATSAMCKATGTVRMPKARPPGPVVS